MSRTSSSLRRLGGMLLPYAFIGPSFLLVMAVLGYPALAGVRNSFTEWNGIGPSTFTGLENYRQLIADPVFWKALRNTAFVAATTPLWILVDLGVASLLHQHIAGWKVFRSIYFMPVVMSAVVIGILFNLLLSVDGPLNSAFRFIGLPGLAMEWLGNPRTALPAVVFVMWWSNFGEGTLIFLAGLSTMPMELFDAARVDGASRLQSFWHVTMPLMRRIIEFYAILLMLIAFKGTFSFIYVMTQGGPGDETMVLDYLIYQQAFEFNKIGYASAIGIALLVALIAITIVQWRILQTDE